MPESSPILKGPILAPLPGCGTSLRGTGGIASLNPRLPLFEPFGFTKVAGPAFTTGAGIEFTTGARLGFTSGAGLGFTKVARLGFTKVEGQK